MNTSFQNNITPDTGNENDVSVNIYYQLSSDEQENVNENNVITEILTEESQENQNNDDIENSNVSVELSCDCSENETEDAMDDCENEFSEVEAANILLELHNKYRETQDQCLLQKGTELCSAFEKKKRVSLLQFLKNDDDLNTFTGINFRLLNNLATAVRTCEDKPNRCITSVEERIVICLCKLKLNLSFKCLAVLFSIGRHACSRLFFTTLHTLAFVLKNAIYWPTKDEILRSMPRCFNLQAAGITTLVVFESWQHH